MRVEVRTDNDSPAFLNTFPNAAPRVGPVLELTEGFDERFFDFLPDSHPR